MTTDDKIGMKKYNTILTNKRQQYQRYIQEKLINMNVLQAKKKYFLLIKAG